MQDYPTNDEDRKSMLYWMEQGLCCNIVPNVDQQLSLEIRESRSQFSQKLDHRDLLQGRARRVREESIEKTGTLAGITRALWLHVKSAINLLELDPEIADLMGIPEYTSKMPTDRAEYWISAVDTILRGREQATQLGLPEFGLVPYTKLEEQRNELHTLNTRYNSHRNDLFLAGEAVKRERERADRLIRKLSANLRYLLCDCNELEIRQTMRRFGFTFRGDAPRVNPEPATTEPGIDDSTVLPGDEQDGDEQDGDVTTQPDMHGEPNDGEGDSEPVNDTEPASKPNEEPGFEPNSEPDGKKPVNNGRDVDQDQPTSDTGSGDTIAPQPRL